MSTSKFENVHYPGLLQPLPIPSQPWKDISMDFVEGLPISEHKIVIFVVVDQLTKFAQFVAIPHPYTAKQVDNIFFDQIHKLRGLPKSTVSDRDAVFISTFWSQLFKLLGT